MRVDAVPLGGGPSPWGRGKRELRARTRLLALAAFSFAVGLVFCRGGWSHARLLQALGLEHPVLDFHEHGHVLFEIDARVVAALTDALATVAVPGAGLVDDL